MYLTSCVNFTLVIVLAAVCAVLCVIVAVESFDGEAYGEYILPALAMPPFWCFLLFATAFAAFGAALGIVLSVPSYSKSNVKEAVLFAVCAAVVSYAWIPLVYRAGNFLIAAGVCATALVCTAFALIKYARINKLAALLLCMFGAWMLYLFLFSLGLWIV